MSVAIEQAAPAFNEMSVVEQLLNTGFCVSLTVTLIVQGATLPLASVSVNVIGKVVPISKRQKSLEGGKF
jgi:hypothetical protein